jgi:hypothetical protein
MIGLKEYRETEGFKAVLLLRREIGDESEYVLVTLGRYGGRLGLRRSGAGARGLLP